MFQLQARVVTAIGEAGAINIAIFFNVLVVGRTSAQASPFEAGQRVSQFATDIETLSTQVSGGRVFVLMTVVVAVPMIVVMAVIVTVAAAMQSGTVRVAVLVFVAVTGQTVAAFTVGVGRAYIATVPNKGEANAACVRAGVGVLDASIGPIGDAIVAAAVRGTFYVQGDVAFTGCHFHCTDPATISRGTLGAYRAFKTLFGNGRGDFAIQHVDHATNGAAPVKQGRGAAQHFNAIRLPGVDCDGVVGRDGRRVHDLCAIAQNFDARCGLAANDGAAGTATKAVYMDADFTVQQFTQGAAAAQIQFGALQDRAGGGQLGLSQGQGAGRDSDRGQFRDSFFNFIGLGRGAQKQSQG